MSQTKDPRSIHADLIANINEYARAISNVRVKAVLDRLMDKIKKDGTPVWIVSEIDKIYEEIGEGK